MKEKEGRIEELEEALRESVKITAEREMLLMEQKMQIDASQNTVRGFLLKIPFGSFTHLYYNVKQGWYSVSLSLNVRLW